MFHIVDAQALGPTVQSVVITATWRPALVHTCTNLYGFMQVVAWVFFGMCCIMSHTQLWMMIHFGSKSWTFMECVCVYLHIPTLVT